MENIPKRIRCAPVAVLLAVSAFQTLPLHAIEWPHYETAVRGYPVMRDANG